MSYRGISKDFSYDVEDSGDVLLKWDNGSSVAWCYFSFEDVMALNAVMPEIIVACYDKAKAFKNTEEIRETEDKIKALQQKLSQLKGS